MLRVKFYRTDAPGAHAPGCVAGARQSSTGCPLASASRSAPPRERAPHADHVDVLGLVEHLHGGFERLVVEGLLELVEAAPARVDEFARYTLSRGVRVAYHHHMGAYVETAADVDALMARTSDAVGLLFDAGHITFAGANPLDVLDKHIARVCHVHCKDVRPAVVKLARNRNWSFLDAVINGAFTVPGDGTVDFPAIIDRLKRHGYRGWLVVEAEQDPVIARSFEYAQLGYRTLRALVDAPLEAGMEAA